MLNGSQLIIEDLSVIPAIKEYCSVRDQYHEAKKRKQDFDTAAFVIGSWWLRRAYSSTGHAKSLLNLINKFALTDDERESLIPLCEDLKAFIEHNGHQSTRDKLQS